MIKIDQISKAFDGKILFDKFSLEIATGEFIIIMGNSGCGKTTLLNMIGAIEPADSGKITVNEIDITNRKNQIKYFREEAGFLFQNFALVENMTVLENLKMLKKYNRTDVSIEEALEFVSMKDKINTLVYKLSGGEQQRVALARLMMKRCSVIFADEPTGSLDKTNSENVIGILKKLQKMGKTIVLVTHDQSYRNIGDRVINI